MTDWIQRWHAEALPIWRSGGWAMYALAVNAVVIYVVGWRVFFHLVRRGAFASPEKAWAKWRRDARNARGPLSGILRWAMHATSRDALRHFFEALHAAEFRPFARDLQVMRVAVSAAPLLGLLGTVTGMLTTFRGLASGAGGEKTMGMIAKGISEALVTTETGLVLALSGLVFQYGLTRVHDRFEKTVAHLETQCGLALSGSADHGRATKGMGE